MTDPATGHTADPEIQRERARLAEALAALRRMHHDVVTTESQVTAATEDNDNFAERLFLRQARERRALALVDLPEVPLFFGRLTFEPGAIRAADPHHPVGATSGDRLYIGRRHVHDGAGRPMVIDWRAPISAAFYRATRDDRHGVLARRRYGFSAAAELTGYEDEPLTGPGDGRTGDYLAAEIERPRSGPMRDIVATIQPEQDDLVRAPLDTTLCVQGAPGTGKTAVGLHRIAYLLYSERERLSRGGVAVVGPNPAFLSYIRNVLPALGEVSVVQTTIDGIIGRTPSRHDEDPRVARLKGDGRMAAVLHRALWLHVTRPAEGLMYVSGAYRHRLSDREVSEIIAALRGTARYNAARATAAKRLAHAVLIQMERRGESGSHATVAASRPVKELLVQVWPKVTPEQVLYRLLSDAGFLTRAARRDLTPDEQNLLLWAKPARSWRSARWSAADTALLDELADLMQRPDTLAHIVIDEAQDLSPMQSRALARRCPQGSLTVLGDIAQGTTPAATDDWPTLLQHLGKPDATLTVLDRGYRVPSQVIDYAARLLPGIAPGLTVPTSARRTPGALRVTQHTPADLHDSLVLTCREQLKGEGSVGVIAADTDITAIKQRLQAEGMQPALLGGESNTLGAERLVCVPAGLAKGLEFDAVAVVEPADIIAAGPRGLNRLYVALTRAVTSLHVLHSQPLPEPLRQSASGTAQEPPGGGTRPTTASRGGRWQA